MMPSPYEAAVLKRLKSTMDARWPHRDRRTDGWIGDRDHQARSSDHNPDPKTGVVRARDIDKDGIHVPTVLASLLSHPSVNYVVWNRRLYRFADQFWPRMYGGSNPHTDHLHVSIKRERRFEEAKASWALIGGFTWRELHLDERGEQVRQLQAYLIAYGFPLRVDNHFGAKTLNAVKAFQKRRGLKVDGLVGMHTQKALASS